MEDDEFFDTDLEEESAEWEVEKEEFAVLSRSTQDIYLDACKNNNIVPSSRFLKQCSTENIELNHYGLGDSGTRAICTALEGCSNVTTLNLHDNGIYDKGITYIAKMLKRNVFITKIDLSGNQIGKEAADELGDMLLQNNTLKEFNISKCNLQFFKVRCAADVLKFVLQRHRRQRSDFPRLRYQGEFYSGQLGRELEQHTCQRRPCTGRRFKNEHAP